MDIDASFIEKYKFLIHYNIRKFSNYYGSLNRYEDFFNTALLVIYNNIDKFDQTKTKGTLEGFLSTKIRQKIIDIIRTETHTSSKKKEKEVHISFSTPELEVVSKNLKEEDRLKEIDDKEIISIALNELDEREKDVITNLFYNDTLSVELANKYKISGSMVSLIKNSAMKKMRDKLEYMNIKSVV